MSVTQTFNINFVLLSKRAAACSQITELFLICLQKAVNMANYYTVRIKP